MDNKDIQPHSATINEREIPDKQRELLLAISQRLSQDDVIKVQTDDESLLGKLPLSDTAKFIMLDTPDGKTSLMLKSVNFRKGDKKNQQISMSWLDVESLEYGMIEYVSEGSDSEYVLFVAIPPVSKLTQTQLAYWNRTGGTTQAQDPRFEQSTISDEGVDSLMEMIKIGVLSHDRMQTAINLIKETKNEKSVIFVATLPPKT